MLLSEVHPESSLSVFLTPRNFSLRIVLGPKTCRDKADTDTSFSLHLSVNLKLQIIFIIPYFYFMSCAPLFSGHHTAPGTKEEQECVRKNLEKAPATFFSFTLANSGSSLERFLTKSVYYLCVVGWPWLTMTTGSHQATLSLPLPSWTAERK